MRDANHLALGNGSGDNIGVGVEIQSKSAISGMC